MEQFVLLYDPLLPFESIAIYPQVILHWMDYPPKGSSSNCTGSITDIWQGPQPYWDYTSIFYSSCASFWI